MTDRRTVFILGAGASAPYGFPLGEPLLKKALAVASLQSHKEVDVKLLYNKVYTACLHWIRNETEKTGKHLSDDVAQRIGSFANDLGRANDKSIDRFLERHDKHIRVGKLCMAAVLLYREMKQPLRHDITGEDREGNWYREFLQMVGVPFGKFQDNQVGIVTFNYDRSLEHFLVQSLSRRDGAKQESWQEKIAETIPVVHLHGQLGAYAPWPNHHELSPVRYGGEITEDDLEAAANGIRIISEHFDRDACFQAAYDLMGKAEQIFFLGFAYDTDNIRRLRLDLLKHDRVYISGTFKGYTEEEKRSRCNRLIKPPKISLAQLVGMTNVQVKWDCLDFFRNTPQIQRML